MLQIPSGGFLILQFCDKGYLTLTHSVTTNKKLYGKDIWTLVFRCNEATIALCAIINGLSFNRQENDELVSLTGKLKDQVFALQQELQWHLNNGCHLRSRARQLIAGVMLLFQCQKSLVTQFRPNTVQKCHTACPLNFTWSL